MHRSLLLLSLALLGTAPAPRGQGPPHATGAPEPPATDSPPAATSAQEPDVAPRPPRAGGAPPSDDAFRMGSPPSLPEGTTQEEMWPAATAEGWREPCLVHWQRSFDDALRVARAQHRPILVAVNMDGEIASEHFAGVRYRDPEVAALMNRYACVIASVYRHTPRDYDEDGRRIECPRFGTVTCGEHIEAERELYDRYFDGKRVSPRHIVLGLDEKETLDVYYSWDTASVTTTFRRGVEGWPDPIQPFEPTLPNLAKSADAEDRELLERTYREGSRETRRAILQSLVDEHVVDQVEVLRAAVFGFDPELARLARRALARCETDGALDLIAEALKAPLESSERELLLGAVDRLAETLPRARTLRTVQSSLATESRHIDVEAARALARQYEESSLRGAPRADATLGSADPDALLALAGSLLERGRQAPERRFANLLLADARSAALEAERAGVSGPELDAVLALVALEQGDRSTARTRAVAAVEGGWMEAPAGADTEVGALDLDARSRVLWLFADERQLAIRRAYHEGREWPAEWLSDVVAAHEILDAGPLADAETLLRYHDFLRWIGATPRADDVLENALQRFPDSPLLHERLRAHLLWNGGPEGLERGYRERLAAERAAGGEPTQLTWFAGYASLVAAEHHRRRGEFELALESYGRALAFYERNVELFPEGRETCEHFVALGRAGRARVDIELGELQTAAAELLTGLQLSPDSAATPDGLNITPVATAKLLAVRLEESGDADRAAAVRAALDALDPSLLEPPPSEVFGPRRRGSTRAPGTAGTTEAARPPAPRRGP